MLIHQETIATHDVLVQVPSGSVVGLLGDVPGDAAANAWVSVAANSCLQCAR